MVTIDVFFTATLCDALDLAFHIKPSQSELQASATFVFELVPQQPSSNQALLEGTINAVIDEGFSRVRLPGNSSIIPIETGQYLPGIGGSSVPSSASFAFQIPGVTDNGYFATRNMAIDVMSDWIPLTHQSTSSGSRAYTFASNTYVATFGGDMDVQLEPLFRGRFTAAGNPQQNVSLVPSRLSVHDEGIFTKYGLALEVLGAGSITISGVNGTVGLAGRIVAEAEKKTRSQKIFVDWFTPTSSRFEVPGWYEWFPYLKPDINIVPEPGPLVFDSNDMFAAYRSDVESHLTTILAASGLSEIEFVNHTGDDVLVVRFAPPVDLREDLRGLAYNVGRRVGQIDQFNRRLDGEVAIFVDPSNTAAPKYSSEYVAEAIAHEVGHGLGLRHVNPQGAISLMDYDVEQGDVEEFINGVFDIIEPPEDGGDLWGATHNPQYHLGRFTLGLSHDALLSNCVMPGEWDLREYRDDVTLSLERIGYSGELYSIVIQEKAADEWFTIWKLDQLTPGSLSSLQLLLGSNSDFRVLASSTLGSDPDLVFGIGDVDSPNFTFSNVVPGDFIAGQIYQYDVSDNTFTVVGTFDAHIVPEPSTIVLSLVGSACLSLVILRRKKTVTKTSRVTATQ